MASTTPFGEHLKRERELRGVSLDEIAAATRIKTSFLEALENGRWHELPGGAFNRGFIRTTARFLGLDEDGMVAEYALETNSTSPSKTIAESSGAMPRDYAPIAIATVVVLLIAIAAAWFGHHEYVLRKQRRIAAQAAASTAPTVSTVAAASSASNPAASPAGPTAGDKTNEAPSTSTSAAASSSASAVVAASPSESIPTAPLKLKIEASKRVDAKVVADGKTLFKGRLHSDAPKTFEASNGFEVTASDSNVVQLELNGQNVPFQTAGRRGSISLSRKDLKPAVDTSH